MATQLSVARIISPAGVQNSSLLPCPPQSNHFAAGPDCRVKRARATGALIVLVAVQLSVLGLYLAPVFRKPMPFPPPHTIISLPVHTAV